MADTRASLLVRLQKFGDPASWSEFHALYEPLLQRFAMLQGLPAADAADVVQEVFIRLLRSLRSFQFDASRGRFRTWLRRIAHNCVIDWRRRRRRRVVAQSPQNLDQIEALDKEFDWVQEHRRRVFEHALEAVKVDSIAKTWLCFERHVLQRRPAGEVAAEVGLTSNGVYINSVRVLERIRRKCAQFDEELFDAGDAGLS